MPRLPFWIETNIYLCVVNEMKFLDFYRYTRQTRKVVRPVK